MNLPNLEELTVESRAHLERELTLDVLCCFDCAAEIGLRELYGRTGHTLICAECLEQRAEAEVERLTVDLRSVGASLRAIQSVRQAHV